MWRTNFRIIITWSIIIFNKKFERSLRVGERENIGLQEMFTCNYAQKNGNVRRTFSQTSKPNKTEGHCHHGHRDTCPHSVCSIKETFENSVNWKLSVQRPVIMVRFTAVSSGLEIFVKNLDCFVINLTTLVVRLRSTVNVIFPFDKKQRYLFFREYPYLIFIKSIELKTILRFL